jgi:hypothetical protein
MYRCTCAVLAALSCGHVKYHPNGDLSTVDSLITHTPRWTLQAMPVGYERVWVSRMSLKMGPRIRKKLRKKSVVYFWSTLSCYGWIQDIWAHWSPTKKIIHIALAKFRLLMGFSTKFKLTLWLLQYHIIYDISLQATQSLPGVSRPLTMGWAWSFPLSYNFNLKDL